MKFLSAPAMRVSPLPILHAPFSPPNPRHISTRTVPRTGVRGLRTGQKGWVKRNKITSRLWCAFGCSRIGADVYSEQYRKTTLKLYWCNCVHLVVEASDGQTFFDQ